MSEGQHAEQPGSKYKRLLHQTLPEGQAGAFVVVDVYDILRAWDVTCPAIQHAQRPWHDCAGLEPGRSGDAGPGCLDGGRTQAAGGGG